jgi:hypothetical protein
MQNVTVNRKNAYSGKVMGVPAGIKAAGQSLVSDTISLDCIALTPLMPFPDCAGPLPACAMPRLRT